MSKKAKFFGKLVENTIFSHPSDTCFRSTQFGRPKPQPNTNACSVLLVSPNFKQNWKLSAKFSKFHIIPYNCFTWTDIQTRHNSCWTS